MEYINQPIRLHNVEAKNRLVMPPMATYRANENGSISEANLEYYGARAKGGNIGIITTEHFYIVRQGQARKRQISIAEDDKVEGLRKLVKVLHQSGSLCVAQLNHAGMAALSEASGMESVGPSAIPMIGNPLVESRPLSRELSLEEIERLPELFANAALRAKEAGYDGVEIHAAHGYLLDQFYSPLTNKRTDIYGGSLENRIRLHVKVIRAVRQAVGNDYMVAIRFGGCDYMEGGSTIDEAVAASQVFEKEGIDYLSLTGGMCRYMRDDVKTPGYFGDLSEAVKNHVNIPVLLTGGVTDIEDADRLLAEGKADMIGVGRALLKDPNWADKAFL